MNFTHQWLSKERNFQKHLSLEGRIRGAHSSLGLLASRCIGSEVIAGFCTVEAYCSCSFTEIEHRLQSSNVPRVYWAGQPATICLEDKTGTLLCYKMQLGESTAVEEELLPNNTGYVLGTEGRRGVTVHEKEDSEDVRWMSESTGLVS